MDHELSAAARYRVKAKEVRTIAESMTDPNARQTLLTVAEDYVRMAQAKDRAAESSRLVKRLANPAAAVT